MFRGAPKLLYTAASVSKTVHNNLRGFNKGEGLMRQLKASEIQSGDINSRSVKEHVAKSTMDSPRRKNFSFARAPF